MGMKASARPSKDSRLVRVAIGRKELLITRTEALALRLELDEVLEGGGS